MFSIIGLIILVIACINFMNLSTARASRRMKEVGIKKAVGAWRSSLVVQFFGESLLIAFTSLAVAMLLVGLLLPFFNDITGKQLVFVLTKERVLAFLSITMTTGILAGVYPALYLSGFKPAQILKGKIISSHSETIVRKGLVIFQFAVSIIFILSVLVIHRQMEFIQSRNLGYDKDHIIYFEIEGTVATSLDAFLNDVKAVPGVVNASAIVGNIVGSFGQPFDVAFEDKKVPVNSLMIDYGMIETLGIPMKLGREFSSNFNDNDKVVINKAAADQLGVTDPIGKAITFWDRKFEIVGVTENFHYRSLYEEITPLIFTLETQQLMNVFIRLDGNGQEEGIQNLASFYKTFNPGYTFDYNFLDYAYQAQYKSEKQVASLSLWFSMLAIIIACLGLLGLAAFTAEKKTKEIGIRKVMGATPAGIAWLLSVEFIKLVLIAVAIALPLSFFVIEEWLQRFAYSIDLEIWFFASAGLIAVLIAVATISGQSIKASLANPVDCLKEE
ncbi:MAG: FtsX-like permease family protein [Bacteroidota bacterium]